MTIKYGYFHHKEVGLPSQCVDDCSHQGDCSDDVEFWQRKVEINLSRQEMIDGLSETGGWTEDELEKLDDDSLEQKVLWIVANDIKDEQENK